MGAEVPGSPGGSRQRVAIFGANEWGTALARAIGSDKCKACSLEDTVRMWTPDERVGGRRLCDLINDQLENVKYLPGFRLPINVVAEPSACRAAKGASLIIFTIPLHQILPLLPLVKVRAAVFA
jgi:glycerol-3-phosphate dehydrogenase (NAD+)